MTTLPILVAFDGSDASEWALTWGATEARATGTPLRVLHVADVPRVAWERPSLDLDQEALDRAAERVLAQSGSSGTTVERASGAVVAELLRQAESAALLVVGSRGHGRAEELLIGSVSQHVARHASCSVVVVRPPRSAEAGRIVVGVDGSPGSAKAVEYACRRAARTGEVVVAIHAWHDPVPSTDVWRGRSRDAVGSAEREALLTATLEEARSEHPGVVIEEETVPVPPARCLVDASAQASLVVVGARGSGFFPGLLLGSVSHAVLQRAECPVVVAR